MIVSESDLLVAALDRRLRVDRLLAVDAPTPITNADDETRAPLRAPSAGPPTIAERLPLGQRIDARVIEVPSPDHVVVEIEGLIVALSWPRGSGPAPLAGGFVSLRVLSHNPLLLFESARVDPARDDGDTPTRLSEGALSLQARGHGAAVRFTAPILAIDVDEATATATSIDESIPLDDVIVARVAHGDPGSDSVARAVVDRTPESGLPVPLILEGPAWPGQPVELVVRRERADESFDNPVLDQWYGDIVMELPRLGRVAGHLAWSMQGLRIRLEGRDHECVEAMNAATGELAAALGSVDLPVLALSVSRPYAEPPMPHSDHG